MVSMFWLKRMKKAESRASSWVLPYGDLMSLLLAVFVMIAAMSELRAGARFDTVGAAVRSAFGFSPGGETEAGFGTADSQRRLSLIEQLEQAGLRRAGTGRFRASDEDLLGPCDVVTEPDRLIIRVAGPVSFEAFSARLKPRARRVTAQIAEYLIGGQAWLEVRGHNGDGPVPPDVPFRDGLDLSYARARAVADELSSAGVSRDRLHITACGDNDPLAAGPGTVDKGANRRIEIIVHATEAASRVQAIAEKERVEDG